MTHNDEKKEGRVSPNDDGMREGKSQFDHERNEREMQHRDGMSKRKTTSRSNGRKERGRSPRVDKTKSRARWCSMTGVLLRLLPLLLLLLARPVRCLQPPKDDQQPPRCLGGPQVAKRHFYYNGENLPIIIETSERVSHELASHILRLLLRDALGYSRVHIRRARQYNSANATQSLNRLAGCDPFDGCSDRPGSVVPETMVNLEIWMPAGFNMETWVNRRYIVDAGPLGPSGRFGWFMPTFTVEENWNSDKAIVDHWRSFKLDRVTSQFSLRDKYPLIRNFLTQRNPGKGRPICNSKRCDENGILHAHWCAGKHNRDCALLMSSFPELDGGILGEQVDSMGLNVNIAWIGSHLHSFVDERAATGLPTLFFNWSPNTLTALGNYTRVKFPLCRTTQQRPTNCDFQVNQLSKAAWVRLRTHTPEAYALISNMMFTQKQYEELLRMYNNAESKDNLEEVYEQVACEWIHLNKHVWRKWIPKNMSNKTQIFLGGMFPITGPYWRQPGIVPGAQMALELINHDPKILPDYELIMLIQDTQCKSDVVMKQFLYFVVNTTRPIAGILGPGCSETTEPIAGVSKHFNTIIVSYSAEAVTLADRDTYPLFFRTVPQMSQNGQVYLELFRRFGWTQVALLAEDGQEFPEYHTFLQDLFLSHHVSVAYHRKIPRQATSEDAVKYIEGLKKTGVRIIILTSYEIAARAVICEAFRQKMTAYEGYVWFMPAWFTRHWWDADAFNRMAKNSGFPPEDIPCSTEQMIRSIQGHLKLSNAFLAPDDSRVIGNMTVYDWKVRYLERLHNLNKDIPRSAYAGYAYDAVWVFGLGLHHLLSEDPSALESLHTEETTRKFMRHLNRTSFMGVSGPVQFRGADRSGIINIHQHFNNESVPLGQYLPDRAAGDKLQLNGTRIRWMTGETPEDGSRMTAKRMCSVEQFRRVLGVDCDTAIVIANVIGVGSFGLFMLICLILVKKRYDEKVRATRERMQELGLLSDTSWLCLDQWEISRDHVVLNRKLGEGAFGTVYGGEALIDDVWVAVAVKTLKIGSNPEEKLDFLSEAEMMKRFDHENIVKLLGVCTRGEPAYTIMEFMLHGDLKTFLLARRHLVAQQETKEAEDITPEVLTRMALDVCYGLKYLTDLKYVHRDLACRNCLVHASKRVKIGDFGMTRPMYDSDYYRFNKRGMLPVRWMAPESLADGIFTSMSDMWSMGVLLYEIMTFGSFPYQGMSNKQVLEYVKNGNIITLPSHCSDELKSVLITCWAYLPERRPTVDDLMDILLSSECLITPCLNAPKTAVALEMQESLDIVPLRHPPGGHRSRGVGAGLRTPSEHNQVSSVSSAHDSKIFTHSPTGCGNEPFMFPPLVGGGGGGVAPLVMIDHREHRPPPPPLPLVPPTGRVLGGEVMARGLAMMSDSVNAHPTAPDVNVNGPGHVDATDRLETLSRSSSMSSTGDGVVRRSSHTHHADDDDDASTASDPDDATAPCLPRPSPGTLASSSADNLSTSPDSPLPPRYIALPASSLDDRAACDSDYSSQHSKDIWNMNGAAV